MKRSIGLIGFFNTHRCVGEYVKKAWKLKIENGKLKIMVDTVLVLELFSIFHFNRPIVGILNVTPDSYYDGGKWNAVDAAVKRAGEMIAEGADWIEIGGESTGPKSKDVSLEEERLRVIPVIEAIRRAFPEAKIAVDTYKAAIASEAISAGAAMVNDVTAGRGDPEMMQAIADACRGIARNAPTSILVLPMF